MSEDQQQAEDVTASREQGALWPHPLHNGQPASSSWDGSALLKNMFCPTDVREHENKNAQEASVCS